MTLNRLFELYMNMTWNLQSDLLKWMWTANLADPLDLFSYQNFSQSSMKICPERFQDNI